MIDYNYTTDLKPSIATVPKFLSAEDFRYATEFAKKAPYIWGESDGPGKLKPTGMIYDIMDEMIGVGELVAKEVLGQESELLKPFRFNRYEKGELHPTSNSPFPWS